MAKEYFFQAAFGDLSARAPSLTARLRRIASGLMLLMGLLLSGATPTLAAAAGQPVIVGVLAAYPPFQTWSAQGEAQGYDVDLLRALEQTSDYRFDFRRYDDFGLLLRDLREGRVQLATSMAAIPEREADLVFSRPYVTQDQALVGRLDQTSAPGSLDLGGLVLALTGSHASASAATEQFPLARRRFYPDIDATLDAVVRGEAELAFGGLPVLQTAMQRRGDIRILRTYSLPAGRLCLAGPPESTALVQRLDALLATLPATTFAAIAERWLPHRATGRIDDALAGARPGPPTLAPESTPPVRVGYIPSDTNATRTRYGAASGPIIDLFNAIARRAGLRVAAYVPVTLAEALAQVSRGDLDLVLGVTETADRRRDMAFVGPYRSAPVAIVSRASYPVWGLQQLQGRRLALVKRYFAAAHVGTTEPRIHIVDCAQLDDCLRMVEMGSAEATLHGIEGLDERLRERRGAPPLAVNGIASSLFDEHNIALAPGRRALAGPLRDALDRALVEDLPAIERRWADRRLPSSLDRPVLERGILAVALGVALIVMAWWLHSRRLKVEIARTHRAQGEAEGYLAFMAHEVRNALNSVTSAIDLLRGQPPGPPLHQQLLRTLAFSTRATLGLLNGLLDRHRLHQGQSVVRLHAESLRDVVTEVVDEVRPVAQQKRLELLTMLDANGWWDIDRLRLQQVLRNLLINAIKFSNRGHVAVMLTSEGPEADGAPCRFRLTVEDEGPGIAAEQRAALFQRLHSLGGDRPGSGLGLALSRELMQAMGGSLTLGRSDARGTQFIAEWTAFPASARGPAPGERPTRVLIVEDAPVTALLLEHAFDALGIATRSCRSVRGALDALRQRSFHDLVLSDLHVEDGDIEDLLAAWPDFGASPQAVGAVLIGMSGDVDPARRTALLQRGCVDVLAKDANVQRFVDLVCESYAARTVRRTAAPERSAP